MRSHGARWTRSGGAGFAVVCAVAVALATVSAAGATPDPVGGLEPSKVEAATDSGASVRGEAGASELTRADAGRPGPATVTVSSPASVAEDTGTVQFTISVSRQPNRPIEVSYTTADGTAGVASDYGATFGTLRLWRQQLTATVEVPIINDGTHELPRVETFGLEVSTNSGAAATRRDVQVVDDDRPPECIDGPAGTWECAVPAPEDADIDTRVLVALPLRADYLQPVTFPVVYLLHGVSDDYKTLVNKMAVEQWAIRHKAILVMPDASNNGKEPGWYSDWVGCELPRRPCRPDKVDIRPAWKAFHTGVLVRWIDEHFATGGAGHRGIAGVSMGGFGALAYAGTTDVYSAVGSVSGLLDTQLYGPAEGYGLFLGHGFPGFSLGTPDNRVWGDPILDASTWDANNPRKLAEADSYSALDDRIWLRVGYGVDHPPSDSHQSHIDDYPMEHFMWQTNQSFKLALDRSGTSYNYRDYPGRHDWPHWERELAIIVAEMVHEIS